MAVELTFGPGLQEASDKLCYVPSFPLIPLHAMEGFVAKGAEGKHFAEIHLSLFVEDPSPYDDGSEGDPQ